MAGVCVLPVLLFVLIAATLGQRYSVVSGKFGRDFAVLLVVHFLMFQIQFSYR